MNNVWEVILDLYKKNFNIPSRVIDYLACKDILDLCLQGWSNNKIGRYFDSPNYYIRDVLKYWLNFDGWEEDLDYSPIMVYNNHPEYMDYMFNIEIICPYPLKEYVSYDLCKKYQRLVEEMDRKVKIYVK